MPLGEIIEKSFHFTRKNKAMWFFGVISALFSQGSSILNYSDNSRSSLVEKLLANSGVLAALVAAGLVVVILAIVFSNWSAAALIDGANKIDDGETVTRKGLSSNAWPKVGTLIVLNVLLPLAALLLVAFMAGLTAVLFNFQSPVTSLVGTLLIMAMVAVGIPILFYLSQVWILAQPFVVIRNNKAIRAISEARKLIKGIFWKTFLFHLVIGLLIGGVGLLAILPMVVIVFGFMVGVGLDSIPVMAVIGTLGLLFLFFVFFATGILEVFSRTAQTLWWKYLLSQKSTVTGS